MTRRPSGTQGKKRRGTRAETLADAITSEILNGTLPPGARLEEQALAEKYGVSRTPVREAIRQVAAIGLVEVRPHRGAHVMKLSVDTLLQRFETMAELEASCARLAAQRMNIAERASLASMLDQEMALSVRRSVTAFRSVQFRVEERLSLSQTEHEAVMAAIADRDPECAAHAMRAHIHTVRDTAQSYLERSIGLSI